MIFRENLKRAALVWTVVIGHSTTLMAEVFEIFPGEDAEEALQETMILAAPGDEIVIAEGIYSIKNQLSLAVDDLTITGAGMDKTILNFASQIGGSEGFLVTGNGTILRDFAIEDTKGDAIKSKGVDGIAFVRMRVEWTGGPDVNNGAYGFYPVSSRNVLLDGVVAIGASDAGIYVGQSTNIIARNSQAAFNVAGLEIENCHFADVYNNVLTDNTGGILVFDLPDIPQQGGHHVRVFNNRSFANNTTNFAPEGNIVGLVPSGTGVLIMANSDVEVFDNVIENNQTVGILFGSYIKETEDENYHKHPRRVHIHHNTFKQNGQNPDTGEFGSILNAALGRPIADIVWDGVLPLSDYILWGQTKEDAHSIHDNAHEDDNRAYANADFIGWFGWPFPHRVSRGLNEHSAFISPLPPVTVTIRGINVDDPKAWTP